MRPERFKTDLEWLMEPCQSPEELDEFIAHFFKIRFPWHYIDPLSTSSPLLCVWSIYNVLLTGIGNHRHVIAASRNSGKTVIAAIIQILSLLHFRRSGVHIASILSQSSAMIQYFDKFVNKIQELAPYKSTDNVKLKQFMGLPANSYTDKDNASLLVVTANKKGANSSRANLITYDEVDLTPQEILAEAAFIADPTLDGNKRDPVFIYLSSRKSNSGPIQELITEAETPGSEDITLHKWSITDMLETCPPEIHKPELGASKAYLNSETLAVIWGEDAFKTMVPEASQSLYFERVVYEGCKTCPAFIACQGLSVKQKGSSGMLRTRKFVSGMLRAIKDTAAIIAQYLNLKPETTGLVFKTFSHYQHVKAPIEFYEWTIGSRFNPMNYSEEEWNRIYEEGDIVELMSITPTKEDCYYAMISGGWTITFGIDWGYNPDPAFVVVIGWHKKTGRLAVLHCDFELNHSNHVWAKYVCETVYPRFPASFVAPDMADPASPTYFVKHKVRSLDSKPSRIETGVSFLRGLLWNPVTASSNFALFDDSQGEDKNKVISEAFSHWTHAKDALGRFKMDKFSDDQYTHPLDCIRYATAPFVSNISTNVAMHQNVNTAHAIPLAARGDTAAIQALKEKNSMMNQFSEFMNREHGVQNALEKPADILAGNRSNGTPTRHNRSGIKFKF